MNLKLHLLTIPIFFILLGIHFILPESHAFKPETGISITSPTYNQVIYSNNITITGTSYNATSILLGIDQAPSIPIFILPDGTWTHTTTVSNGFHSIIVQSSNINGNLAYDTTHFNSISSHQTPTKYNFILVEYSEACQRMLDNNITSDCPTLDKLMKYDNTNQNITGHLSINSKGQFYRTNPVVSNYYEFWNGFTSPPVCIDCRFNLGAPDLVPLIMIEPVGFTYVAVNSESHHYINQTQGGIKQNYTITSPQNIPQAYGNYLITYHDRYVTPNCLDANIVFTPSLFVDTINYMISGCKHTNFNNTSITINPEIITDPTSSIIYKEKKYESDSLKITKIQNCITHKCNLPKDPFKKLAWG